LGPLLAFGLVCLPTSALALSIVANSLALFWPLFVIQAFGARSKGENSALLLLAAIMAFGHETSIAFSAVLLLLALLQRYNLAIFVHAVSLTGYAVRLYSTNDWLKARFLGQMSEGLDIYQMFLFFFLGTLLLAAGVARFLDSVRHRAILWALALVNLPFLALILVFFVFGPALMMASAVLGRGTAIVFVSMIAILVWWMHCDLPAAFGRFSRPNFGAEWRNFIAVTTIAALVGGAIVDFRLTRNWQASVSALKTYVAGHAGASCVQVDRGYYYEKLVDGGIEDFCLSHLWAVIQPTNEVEKFVWINPETEQGKPFRNLCHHLTDDPGEIETNFRGAPFPVYRRGFRYGFLP
jgi:hypothetical protein